MFYILIVLIQYMLILKTQHLIFFRHTILTVHSHCGYNIIYEYVGGDPYLLKFQIWYIHTLFCCLNVDFFYLLCWKWINIIINITSSASSSVSGLEAFAAGVYTAVEHYTHWSIKSVIEVHVLETNPDKLKTMVDTISLKVATDESVIEAEKNQRPKIKDDDESYSAEVTVLFSLINKIMYL